MRLQRTVVTDKPLGKVFDYLSDFTSTTDWDPGTVTTIRLDGDGGVGTSYLNTSEFLGRRTELRYVVQEFVPGERVRLRGENKTVISVDTHGLPPGRGRDRGDLHRGVRLQGSGPVSGPALPARPDPARESGRRRPVPGARSAGVTGRAFASRARASSAARSSPPVTPYRVSRSPTSRSLNPTQPCSIRLILEREPRIAAAACPAVIPRASRSRCSRPLGTSQCTAGPLARAPETPAGTSQAEFRDQTISAPPITATRESRPPSGTRRLSG